MARWGLIQTLCQSIYNIITLAASVGVFYLILSGLKIDIVGGIEIPSPPLREGKQYPNLLEAYDCSNPKDLKANDFSSTNLCDERRNLTSFSQGTFQLLRLDRPTITKGYTCRILETRKVRYCHPEGPSNRYSEYDTLLEPVSVSQHLCEYMWNYLSYVDPFTKRHQLKRNGITEIQYADAGRFYYGAHDNSSSCTGGGWKVSTSPDTDPLEDVAVDIRLRIYLQEEGYIQRGDSTVEAYSSRSPLICGLEQKGCTYPTITHVWTPEKSHCPLTLVGQVQGLVMQDSYNQSVFLSQDGKQIRLVLGPTRSFCGKVVITTNQGTTVVYPLRFGSPFPGSSDSDYPEVVNTPYERKDHLLLETKPENTLLNPNIQKEVDFTHKYACLRREQDLINNQWVQNLDPDVTQWNTGPGTYAMATGGLVCHIKCRKTYVEVRPEAACYMSLPVRLVKFLPTEHGTFTIQREDTPYFLESISHRLLSRGYQIPCSSNLVPQYNNIWGNPVKAKPLFQMVNQTEDQRTSSALNGEQDSWELIHMNLPSSPPLRPSTPPSSPTSCSSSPRSFACIVKTLQDLGSIASLLVLLLLVLRFMWIFSIYLQHFWIIRSFSGTCKAFYWATRVPTFLLKRFAESWRQDMELARVTIRRNERQSNKDMRELKRLIKIQKARGTGHVLPEADDEDLPLPTPSMGTPTDLDPQIGIPGISSFRPIHRSSPKLKDSSS